MAEPTNKFSHHLIEMIAVNKWTPFLSYGMVLDDYTSTNDEVLSLKSGEPVVIIERIHNWFRGYSAVSSKRIMGIFPQAIIKVLNNASSTPICHLNWEKLDLFYKDQSEIHKITIEIDAVIRDWYEGLLDFLINSDYNKFQKLMDSFYNLVDKRNQLISNCQSLAQKEKIKNDIDDIVDLGNRLITKESILRDKGVIAKKFRFMHLYKAHCQRFTIDFDGPSPPEKDAGSTKIQLLIKLKGLVGVDNSKPLKVQIGIWRGKSEDLYQPAVLRTPLVGSIVFADIDRRDVFSEKLFLILRVCQTDRGILRPLGNGSFDLSKILLEFAPRNCPILQELSINIPIPSHENDYQKIFAGSLQSSKSLAANLSLSVFSGEIEDAFQNYPIIFHSAVIHRPFGKVYLSENENSLHMTLHSADLSNQKKLGSTKNIQVQIEVKNQLGEKLCCLDDGSFGILYSSVRSFVYFSNDSPVWDLHLRIVLEPLRMLQSHIVVTIGNVDDSGVFQPFSFAYLPLFYSQDEPVRDDCHILSLYKFDKNFAKPSIYMTVPAGPSIFVPSGLSSLSVEELYSAAEYMAANNIRLKDTVRLSTKLDSSLLTKCLPLMMLLHWKNVVKNHRGNVFSIIRDCYDMDELEKVKFYPQMISSLIDILETEPDAVNQNDLSCDIVHLLINIFLTIKTTQIDSKTKLFDLCKSMQISRTISKTILSAIHRIIQPTCESEFSEKKFIDFVKTWDLIFLIILSPFDKETDRHEVQNDTAKIFKLLSLFLAEKCQLDSQILVAENLCCLLNTWSPFYPMETILGYVEDFLIATKKKLSLHLIFMHAFIREEYIQDSSCNLMVFDLIINWLSLYLAGKWGCTSSLTEYTRVSVTVLAFTTTQKRQELSHLLKFLSALLDILYSLPIDTCFDRLGNCLWVLLETFCNYSDWKNMKYNSSRQSKGLSTIDDSSNPFTDTMGKAFMDLSDLASIICSFADLVSDQCILTQFTDFLKVKGIEECAVYVAQWLDAISSFLTNIFPTTWVALNMAIKALCLRIIKILSKFMLQEFSDYSGRTSDNHVASILSQNKVDGYQLWRRFFRSILTLTHLHHSMKNELSSQNDMILKVSGFNILEESCCLIENIWEALASNDNYYQILKLIVPKFSAAFLEMALSKDENLRSTGINLLFAMIKLEFRVNRDFSRVEHQIFEQMPWIVEKSKMACDGKAIISSFSDRFSKFPGDIEENGIFLEQGKKFISFLDKFLSLASDINNLSDDALNVDEKAYATMKMIQFLSDLNKPEMLIVFIQSLYDLHLSQERYTEAGLLLKQYGDKLPWSNGPPDDRLLYDETEKPKFRDDVYKRCVDMFDRGHAWERSIEVCRDLSHFFQFESFDFRQLSEILNRQAEITEKVRTGDRFFSNYYLVSFYGYGFSNIPHGKMYVYKGLLWEKLGSFCERILKRHPGSTLIKAAPLETESMENKKLILIRSIDAYMDIQMLPTTRGSNPLPWPKINDTLDINILNGPQKANDLFDLPSINKTPYKIPEYIYSYFESNETNIFTFGRPIRKVISEDFGDLGKDACDYLSTFSQQNVIYSKERFPGLLSRSEVMSTNSFELSPIENAIITIRKKSKELSNFLKLYSDYTSLDLSPDSKNLRRDSQETSDKSKKISLTSNSATNHFTMALHGAVDAPVNGGIPLFRAAFFSDIYRNYSRSLGTDSLIESLRQAIDDQVIIMHQCLKVHNMVISSEMRPLHDQLIASFNKNFSEEISRINLRPLRLTPDNMPFNRFARNSGDMGFNLKSSPFSNRSLLDLRKSGLSGLTGTGEELRRFSDMKRQTALNLLLLESSGLEEDRRSTINMRNSDGREPSKSSLVSESDKSEQHSPVRSPAKSRGKFAKKLMKFIDRKKTKGS